MTATVDPELGDCIFNSQQDFGTAFVPSDGKPRQHGSKHAARGRDRISVWVSGKSFPDKENLEKLARVLGVKAGDLAPQAELKAAHHGAADWSIVFFLPAVPLRLRSADARQLIDGLGHGGRAPMVS
jgi:hypothetical protein